MSEKSEIRVETQPSVPLHFLDDDNDELFLQNG